MHLTAGDPGSCSQLGGALRSTAAALAEAGAGLGGDLLPGRLVEELLPLLDDAGARLQLHAQELAELVGGAARLRTRVTAAGLDLEGTRVVEPAGVVDLAAAHRRMRASADLQACADRLAARLRRSRAELARRLQQTVSDLGRVASADCGPMGID